MLGELTRDDKAILLEKCVGGHDGVQRFGNSIAFEIGRRSGGTDIVQSKRPWTIIFRAMLARAGATIVSYIRIMHIWCGRVPARRMISADAQVQAVMPYEPYYKLKSSLLSWQFSTVAAIGWNM